MQKVLRGMIGALKKINKRKSIKLILSLILFVTLPPVFSILQKQQNISPKAHAQAAPAAGTLWVYGLQANLADDLAVGWTGQVWYGGPNDINRFNPIPVYTGTHSLSWTDTAQNDEMDLYTSPFNVGQYQYLTFFAQPTNAQQLFQVYLLNGYKQRIGKPLPLAQYGGVPVPGTWTVYDFPIAAFGAGTTSISGLGINDPGNGPQPPIYFDDIAFSVNKGESLGPGPGQATNLPTQPPSTPTPPYYPDISPWIYIIPGIIIFFAIFFE